MTRRSVLVRGAGIIGLCSAWRLSCEGHRVAVVDPDPGRAAARVAAGMLAPVTEVHYGEEALLALMLAGARRWPDFAAELTADAGTDAGFHPTGTVVAARDRDDLEAIEAVAAYQRELGLEVHRLSARDLRRTEPALGPAVRGGLWVPHDHQADPRRTLAALREACRRRGVIFDGDGLGDPDVEVVATGAWSSEVTGLPVRPVKGQVVRLGATGRAVLPRRVVRGTDVYIVPRAGEVVVGATTEERGFDPTPTAGAVADLLGWARELVPGLEEAAVREINVGFRPATPDGGPALGWLGDGRLVAVGHHRNGILLAPLTGDAVAALVAGRDLPEVWEPFRPDRFAGGPPGGTVAG